MKTFVFIFAKKVHMQENKITQMSDIIWAEWRAGKRWFQNQ